MMKLMKLLKLRVATELHMPCTVNLYLTNDLDDGAFSFLKRFPKLAILCVQFVDVIMR